MFSTSKVLSCSIAVCWVCLVFDVWIKTFKMEMEIRSGDVRKDLCGTEYKEETEYVRQRKLVTGKYLMGRMLSLCKKVKKGQRAISREEASQQVAEEVRYDWISKNVYPLRTQYQVNSKEIEKRLR